MLSTFVEVLLSFTTIYTVNFTLFAGKNVSVLIIKGLELAKCVGSLKYVKDCILQVTEAPTTQSIPNNVTYVIWNVIQ